MTAILCEPGIKATLPHFHIRESVGDARGREREIPMAEIVHFSAIFDMLVCLATGNNPSSFSTIFIPLFWITAKHG